MEHARITETREIKHFHFCCGLGGGKKGFNKARPRIGTLAGRYRCIGGIDVDPAAIRDFDNAGPGRPGTVMDLFTREQYVTFHDKLPPAGWREANAVDIRRAAGNESPNVVFISSPCKGASGLLSESLSKTVKYQALNELTLRCVWLMCEAWADDPVDLIVFENVPRLSTRARHLLDQIIQLLQRFGYAVAETTHDCGELGGLAQSRKRFLLVARNTKKVPPFLYEPVKKRLRAVGDILGRMPFPGDAAAGPMHRIPRLQWKTWVRLAFVEAGSDWRSLNKLAIESGYLRDYLIVPDMRNDALGVNNWSEHCGAITANGRPASGAFSVADPRCQNDGNYGQLGVRGWENSIGTITGQRSPIQGGFLVADPRAGGAETHKNVFRVVRWHDHAGTVTSGHGPSSGGGCIADPRPSGEPVFSKFVATKRASYARNPIGGDDQGAFAIADPRSSTGFEGGGKYLVTPFDGPSGTVIAGSTTGQGAFAVADPRAMHRMPGDAYLTGGHYGVVPWSGQSGAVSASAGYDNGRWSIADPRIDLASALPQLDEKLVAIIRALDGTWHRPFTTLELAALQSLIDPDEHWSTDPQTQREIQAAKLGDALAGLTLDGGSDSAWRERIGNAVPPDAAEAIAEVMGTTLLLAWTGETFVLGSTNIWVRPVAIALSVDQGNLTSY
ncbi:MAG: DNA cytosine methyltransferase [Burkholderiaceae bacterium]|nr:DNA cytosine methyltransferase [Burkholderiaceae bacterium]